MSATKLDWQFRCPRCEETDIDNLEYVEAGRDDPEATAYVHCDTCGYNYEAGWATAAWRLRNPELTAQWDELCRQSWHSQHEEVA